MHVSQVFVHSKRKLKKLHENRQTDGYHPSESDHQSSKGLSCKPNIVWFAPLGASVKSLVFVVGERPVMALVAGDRRLDTAALATALGLDGEVERADAELARRASGFAIGAIAPVGHAEPLAIAIDASLGRFATLHAAAGHPRCVFATSFDELVRLTGGVVSAAISS